MIAGNDFPVARTVTVATEQELREALLTFDAVRLAGSGRAQTRVPAPDRPVTVVSLAGMRRILRLEADDLTCSVEAGVRREDLDRELAERRLWLPCGGAGTLGGIFAADEIGPLGPARAEPRSLLLGMTAMLTEGRRFRSGARVVKNVAGFDLPKLFVGSRGRLFAVTELHLKLRPRPRAMLHFANDGLPQREALALTRRLRRHPTRPAVLSFEGSGSFRVHGTLAGEPRHLERMQREFDLRRTTIADGIGPSAVEGDLGAGVPGSEMIRGQIPFGRVETLLDRLPDAAFFRFLGERFSVRLPAEASDELLARLPGLGATGELAVAPAPRRGRRTPGDPVAEDLAVRLRTVLDPRGVLR